MDKSVFLLLYFRSLVVTIHKTTVVSFWGSGWLWVGWHEKMWSGQQITECRVCPQHCTVERFLNFYVLRWEVLLARIVCQSSWFLGKVLFSKKIMYLQFAFSDKNQRHISKGVFHNKGIATALCRIHPSTHCNKTQHIVICIEYEYHTPVFLVFILYLYSIYTYKKIS